MSPLCTLGTTLRLRAAFTLIELLVVIAIIGILMGLIFPAAGSAMNSAKKTTAKNQVVQIATAITAYETEYGRLPASTSGQVDGDLVKMLCTSTVDSNNPRGIIFLEANNWSKGKGGLTNGSFCDPFSKESVYRVVMDTAYANSITVPSQASPGDAVSENSLTLNKRVGVWTVFTNGGKQYLIDSWD